MLKVDDASKKANNTSFMSATPEQRLAVLTALDREQKTMMDARDAAYRKKKGLDTYLPEQRKEPGPGADAAAAVAITADTPTHYFRMMKELALLGYFTSEIGCTKATRYVEAPGRYDPCIPYVAGEAAWADHA
jgi:hypothetical protein